MVDILHHAAILAEQGRLLHIFSDRRYRDIITEFIMESDQCLLLHKRQISLPVIQLIDLRNGRALCHKITALFILLSDGRHCILHHGLVQFLLMSGRQSRVQIKDTDTADQTYHQKAAGQHCSEQFA